MAKRNGRARRRSLEPVPLDKALLLLGEKTLRDEAGNAYRMWKSRNRVPAASVLKLLLTRIDVRREADTGESAELIEAIREIAGRTEQRGRTWQDFAAVVKLQAGIAAQRLVLDSTSERRATETRSSS